MIITKELFEGTTCQEFIDWIRAHPQYYGLNRKQFAKAIRDEEKAGLTGNNWWADWLDINYFKGDAIVQSGKAKRLGIYKAIIPGRDNPLEEFDNIEDALALLEVEKNKRIKEEDPFFHIHIRRDHGASGFQTLGECDTTKDTCEPPTADAYFSTFNIFTGQYENFLTYGQAKNRMIELRKTRNETIGDGYLIAEKVQEIGATDINAEYFVIVQSSTGKRTGNLHKLDRIESRPDRPPKPPKP
jgi:hypothetical protein